MPRTEAGKRLLARLAYDRDPPSYQPGDFYIEDERAIDAIEREAALPDRDALARALPDVMSQEVCDAVMGPGHDPLDLTEEWYMTPRELADAIIAALEQPWRLDMGGWSVMEDGIVIHGEEP